MPKTTVINVCHNQYTLVAETEITSQTGKTVYPVEVYTAPLGGGYLDHTPAPYPADGPFVTLPGGIDHKHPLAAMRPLSEPVTWEEAEKMGIASLVARIPWEAGTQVGHPTKPLTLAWDREYQASDDDGEGGKKRRTEICQTYRCDIDEVSYAFIVWQPPGAPNLSMGVILGGILGWLADRGVINLSPVRGLFNLQLVGHHTLADLQGYVGRQAYRHLARSGGAHFTGKSAKWHICPYKNSRDTIPITLTVRDTMAYTPDDDKSLRLLGRQIGREKVELPDGAIEDMGALLQTNPGLFRHYAIADADIALTTGAMMWGHNSVWPATIASQATKIARESLMRQGNHETKEEMLEAYRGTTLQEVEQYDIDGNPVAHRGRRKKEHKPATEMAIEINNYAQEAYAGGLNIALVVGYICLAIGIISDIDARSYYPMIMALLWELDMGAEPIDIPRGPAKIEDYPEGIHTYGFARARIDVPEGVIIPIGWVRINGGPIFVNQIERGYYTLATIWYALRQGAKVYIESGFCIPANPDKKPFREFAGFCLRARDISDKIFGKKSIQSTLNKLVINATYGQIARGVRDKTVYDAETMGRKDMPMSDISHPVYAAYITAIGHIIIAAVAQELAERGYDVYSAITDGFTTDASLEVVEALHIEGINELLREARKDMGLDPKVWAVKAQATEMVVADAKKEVFRGHKPENNHAMMQGLKPPWGIDKKGQQAREEFVEMWANRTGPITQNRIRLPNVQDIQRGGEDFRFQWEVEVSTNMDYGCRRIPTEVTPVMLDGVEAALVRTRAPRNEQEARDMLEAKEHFSKKSETLKTKKDYALLMIRKALIEHKRSVKNKEQETQNKKEKRAPRAKTEANVAAALLTQYRAKRIDIPQFHGLTGIRIQELVAMAYPQLSKYSWKEAGRKSTQDAIGYPNAIHQQTLRHCKQIWLEKGIMDEKGDWL